MSGTLKDVKVTSRMFSKVGQTDKMKLSWLTHVSFFWVIVTVSAIRIRRHGCHCDNSNFDLATCGCGCGPSASGVVFKAAKLQKPSLLPLSLIRGTSCEDCECPHCSEFSRLSGLPRIPFRTWKYKNNRFRQLFNRFRPGQPSYYPGSSLSQRFPNIFGTPGYVLPYPSNRPLYPTFDGTSGFGTSYPVLNPYYGNSGPFNSGLQTSPLSIKYEEFITQNCDCGNVHSLHNEPNSFPFENDEFPSNNDNSCHCTKKNLAEDKNFLNSKERKKSFYFDNTFEDKLAYGPNTLPIDDITKTKIPDIPEENLLKVEEPINELKVPSNDYDQDDVKNCGCQGKNEKQMKLKKILEEKKTELDLENKIRNSESLSHINRCEKCGTKNFDPIMSFQPIYEFSEPILQNCEPRNMANLYYHYEDGCDEENEEYSEEDFRTLQGTRSCRCESEDYSPRSKVFERLTSNYENARILHLEHSECQR